MSSSSKRACSCSRQDCSERMERFFADPASVFPSARRSKLPVKLQNPGIKETRNKKQAARKQQVFDRVVKLLGISTVPPPKEVNINIHHFHPKVIEAYNEGGCKGDFIDFLLPESLVSDNNLGVVFTDIDAFNCVGTNIKSRTGECSKKKGCSCGLFLNVPFLAAEKADEYVTSNTSERAARAAGYSSSRSSHTAPLEAEILSDRVAAMQAELDSARKELTYATREASDLKRKRDEEQKAGMAAAAEIVRLKSQLESITAENHKLKASSGEVRDRLDAAEKKRRAAQEQAKYHQRGRPSPIPSEGTSSLSYEQLKRLGMSILDSEWHEANKIAAREYHQRGRPSPIPSESTSSLSYEQLKRLGMSILDSEWHKANEIAAREAKP